MPSKKPQAPKGQAGTTPQQQTATSVASRKAQDLAIKALQRKFGTDFRRMSTVEMLSWLTSGLEPLDHLSRGGELGEFLGFLPVGKIVEVYGDEGCGKTSLALANVKQAQKLGWTVIYGDSENALTPARCTAVGVDPDLLVYCPTNTMEAFFGAIETFVETLRAAERADNLPQSPILVVWDSVAGTSNQDELLRDAPGSKDKKKAKPGEDEEGGDSEAPSGMESTAGIASHARIVSRTMRRWSHWIRTQQVACLFLNQIRDTIQTSRFKQGVTLERTFGGRAIAFHATIRYKMTLSRKIKNESTGKFIGIYAKIHAVKNRISAPFRNLFIRFNFTDGIDREGSLLEYLLNEAILLRVKQGSTFYVGFEGAWHRPNDSLVKLFKERTLEQIMAGIQDIPHDEFGERVRQRLKLPKVRQQEVDLAALDEAAAVFDPPTDGGDEEEG